MSAAAWLQFVVVIAAVLVTAVPLGRYMAWAYGDGARPRRPRLPARRAIYISAVPDRPRHRAAMDHLRLHTAGFSIFSFVGVCAATRPGIPAGQPGRALGSGASSLLQHRGQLHDQHQLAELRRRVDHEPPHPDGGADDAELRVRSGGHGRGPWQGPGGHPSQDEGRDHRQATKEGRHAGAGALLRAGRRRCCGGVRRRDDPHHKTS